MDDVDIGRVASTSRRVLANEIATRTTDPHFFAGLQVLPNPDRVLRKLGKDQQVYDDIFGDAHVLGDLRSVRSALLGFEWRLMPGSDDPASTRALELCERVMAMPPAPAMQWSDVIWAMGCAVFRGYAVHEIVWQREGNEIVPVKVVDRPQRRFKFGIENELRLITRDHMVDGIPLGDKKWLLTRHMASFDNPYGVAVFSACFWPYIFKHAGVKYLAKFCEKYGIPWAIGKYPAGTPDIEQKALADRLAEMVEDGVAAIPDTGEVELLEHKQSGQLVHERLINLCNRELSKALTSQTLSGDLTDVGARAASDTHREREISVNQSDRAIIEYSINQLLQWITELNVANATSPTFQFFEEASANTDMVEMLAGAREIVPLSRQEVYDRLQLSEPEDEADTIGTDVPRGSFPPPEFSKCPHCGAAHDFAQADDDPISAFVAAAATMADDAMQLLPEPAQKLLEEIERSGGTLTDFQARLPELWPAIDETRVGELTELVVMTGFLQGMDE